MQRKLSGLINRCVSWIQVVYARTRKFTGLTDAKVPVGKVCLMFSPIIFLLSGGLDSPLLAVFTGSFIVVGFVGVLIMFNARLLVVEKRLGGVLAGGIFIFVSYVSLEVAYWILPQLTMWG